MLETATPEQNKDTYMRSGVKDGRCDVEVLCFGVFVKWYEKWTGPKTAPLLEGGPL
jgi:hypothetical protein